MKNNKNVIIGVVGFGRFGTLMASVLARSFDVKVVSGSNSISAQKRAKIIGVKLVKEKELELCDYVILAVPISRTKNTIKSVVKYLKGDSVLMDVCSVKVLPCKWLKKYVPKNINIIGTHPMFGPVTTKFDIEKGVCELKGKQMVICPLRISNAKLRKIESYLKGLGLDVINTSPADHDRQNAKTLSLVHFLGRSLTRARIGEQRIFTPGYSDVLKILPHTNQDDWQLFYDMNNLNPYASKVRDQFLKACDSVEDRIIKSNSIDEFDYCRKKINKIDRVLFELLEERMECSRLIGKIKKKKGLKIVDKEREDEIVSSSIKGTRLDESFVKSVYKLIFKESYKKQ